MLAKPPDPSPTVLSGAAVADADSFGADLRDPDLRDPDLRDNGARDPSLNEAGKARKCISGGPATDADEMVRFVLSPDGVVVPDLARKLPGRGAWVSADRASIARAATKGLFARAFRRAAQLGPGETADAFAGRIEAGLRARALSAIGLARRSGDVVTGFEKVREALKGGPVAFVFSAADAADDGAGKLARLAAAVRPASAASVRVVRAFAVDELSAALGREGVRHVCVAPGAAADRIGRELLRLAGFVPELKSDLAWGPETGGPETGPPGASDEEMK